MCYIRSVNWHASIVFGYFTYPFEHGGDGDGDGEGDGVSSRRLSTTDKNPSPLSQWLGWPKRTGDMPTRKQNTLSTDLKQA